VKVYEILFILWVVVFAMWLYRQFANHNKKRDGR
jgi:hypothetical protein